MSPRHAASAALALALPVTLAACGDDATQAADGTDRITVVTSFYPLQEAVERVGGDHVEVSNLTKPGAEPHDVELTPRDVLSVQQADAVVYLSGFQPAVDDAVAEVDGPALLDVHDAARLTLAASDDGHDHGGHEDEGGEHGEHGEHEEAGGEHDDHDHGSVDPHYWLDPARYADTVDAVADQLAEVDPAHAEEYRAAARDVTGRLGELDREMRAGLADCRQEHLVTSHTAFAYLADAYGLEQESITGLTPETEPGSAQLAEVVAHVEEHGVTTIYAETLVPRDVADTIAREAGATVAVLDPIEGVTDESAADDYLGIMRANLQTLRTGQDCR